MAPPSPSKSLGRRRVRSSKGLLLELAALSCCYAAGEKNGAEESFEYVIVGAGEPTLRTLRPLLASCLFSARAFPELRARCWLPPPGRRRSKFYT